MEFFKGSKSENIIESSFRNNIAPRAVESKLRISICFLYTNCFDGVKFFIFVSDTFTPAYLF